VALTWWNANVTPPVEDGAMTTTTARPEQLTLLSTDEVPAQFRLDEATRRRGLAHIAEIRAQLDSARDRRLQATGRRHSTPRAARPTVRRAA